MRHVVPIGGDHGVLDLGEMVQKLEVQATAGAQFVLVQHIEHAPEADAVAVIHARIVWDVGLGRPVLRQVLEELHVGCHSERDARIVGPFDDRAIIDRSIVEAAGWKGHLVISVRLQGFSLPSPRRKRGSRATVCRCPRFSLSRERRFLVVIFTRLKPPHAPGTSERGGSSACCGRSSVISNQGALLFTKKWSSGRIPGSSSRPPSAIPSSGVRSGRFTTGDPQRLQNPR
jgi:hypothetical protein